jgi:TPP-dependent pyruvate/acetoin dehydrogenase alpha subunit
MLTPEGLNLFEQQVAEAFNAGRIKAPVHLSGGNEERLIEIFQNFISHECWVFSTYRSHYHALLKGVPQEKVMLEILAGRSMNLTFPEYRFFTSAMVAGILPIATGVALALKRRNDQAGHVFCFVGDMAGQSGAFHEAVQYAAGHALPINFVVEDNGMSCDTPTKEAWGTSRGPNVPIRYEYQRRWPHNGAGKWVTFV